MYTGIRGVKTMMRFRKGEKRTQTHGSVARIKSSKGEGIACKVERRESLLVAVVRKVKESSEAGKERSVREDHDR